MYFCKTVLIRKKSIVKIYRNTLQDIIKCINLCVLKLKVKISINYDFISQINQKNQKEKKGTTDNILANGQRIMSLLQSYLF